MITEQAYAKINLFLDVKDCREDGFHNIVSVMHSVTLCDRLTFDVSESEAVNISITTDSVELTATEDNLIYRSALKYLVKFGKTADVKVALEKNIPIGAGLAGGSADAAATLRALNRVFNLATKKQLLELAAEIGSDVPFCLLGGIALCEGRGEIITTINSPIKAHFIIAIGKERVSTPAAYRALDELYRDGFPDESEKCQRLISSLSGKLDLAAVYNIFEDVIKLQEIDKIKELLIKSKAEAVLMSGSGPSVFGVFDSESEAQNAKESLLNAGFDAYYATSAVYGETL